MTYLGCIRELRLQHNLPEIWRETDACWEKKDPSICLPRTEATEHCIGHYDDSVRNSEQIANSRMEANIREASLAGFPPRNSTR